MTHTKQVIASAIILSSILLSGCGPKVPDTNVRFSGQGNKSNAQSNEQYGNGASGNVLGDTTGQETMGSQNYQLQNNAQAQQQTKGTPTMKKLEDFAPIEAKSVTLTTTKGDITFDIFGDKSPITARNFLNLAKAGFYDNIVFHRVIANFMAQVGDPKTKEAGMEAQWGTGGPGYVIPDEFDPSLKFDGPGVVAMANSGPNTGGSQFFITYEATPWLDGKHAIFGKVTAGMDVLEKITQGDKITAVSFK